MKMLYTIVILSLCLGCTFAQFAKVGATSCDLCMTTYKINCTMCYNRCNDIPNLLNCTYTQCTKTDANNNCIAFSNVTKNSSECLGQCCSGFAPNTLFSQTNFNLCIERDASLPNNINIGLTLGLVLALLALLFFAGLACLLAIIMISDRETSKTQDYNQVFAKNPQIITDPSSKPMNTVNINQIQRNSPQIYNNAQYYPTQASYQNSAPQIYNAYPAQTYTPYPPVQQVSGEWMTQGKTLSGRCYLCGNGMVNVVCGCGHEFHYRCLCFNVKHDQKCPLCHETASLNVARIYCTKCWSNFRSYDIAVEKLSVGTMDDYEKIRCPRCQ